MFALAEQVPAGLLSKMLGVHISVAVTWQRASGGDWMGYAAEEAKAATERAEQALRRLYPALVEFYGYDVTTGRGAA
ncbi:hypothetical protein ACIQOF_26910 [Streptomyces sp. NPDC091265]|uniref:hypothetical protein n=1 Tax=unclassified Streptomyces TaxID=2593676 RepID=UPI00344E8A04